MTWKRCFTPVFNNSEIAKLECDEVVNFDWGKIRFCHGIDSEKLRAMLDVAEEVKDLPR